MFSNTHPTTVTVSPDAIAEWHRVNAHVANSRALALLWSRHLSTEERERLGGSLQQAASRHPSAVAIWQYLPGVSKRRAVIDVGEKIGVIRSEDAEWLLREFGELPSDPDMAREEAILRGDLVLIRDTKSVFWRAELIGTDWTKHGEAWEFLLLAAEHALRKRPIDRWSFGEAGYEGIVSKRKHRLKNVPGFPQELIEAFKVAGRGTQKFKLPPQKIHIADRN